MKKLALLFALTVPFAAQAQQAQETFNVGSTVSSTCSIQAPDANLGVYDPVLTHDSVDLTSKVSFTVTCTLGTTTANVLRRVSPLTGACTGGTYMLSETDEKLYYVLHRFSSPGTVWVCRGGPTLAPFDTSTTHSYEANVIVPSHQNVSKGTYRDIISLEVQF